MKNNLYNNKNNSRVKLNFDKSKLLFFPTYNIFKGLSDIIYYGYSSTHS